MSAFLARGHFADLVRLVLHQGHPGHKRGGESLALLGAVARGLLRQPDRVNQNRFMIASQDLPLNMLDVNSQLCRLVKAAFAGEEVIIASEFNAAFEEAVDRQVAELLKS